MAQQLKLVRVSLKALRVSLCIFKHLSGVELHVRINAQLSNLANGEIAVGHDAAAMGKRVVATDDGRSRHLRLFYGLVSRMGLQAEHVLGLGAAVRIDGDLLTITGTLPASRTIAEHLSKNDCDRLIAALLAHEEEVLVAGSFEVIGNVLRLTVLVLAITTGREVLATIRIVIDCGTI